jgi:hypothetical protein
MRPPPRVPLSRTAVVQRRSTPPTSTPPRANTAPLPCRRLLPSAVRTSRRQPPTPHPRPRLHLPEHHRALGYLTDLSFLTDEHPSDPSSELSLPPSSPPPRAHTGEPPFVQKPKLGSSSSRACATTVSSPTPAVGRSDFTDEPPAVGGGVPLPCFLGRAKTPRKAGPFIPSRLKLPCFWQWAVSPGRASPYVEPS